MLPHFVALKPLLCVAGRQHCQLHAPRQRPILRAVRPADALHTGILPTFPFLIMLTCRTAHALSPQIMSLKPSARSTFRIITSFACSHGGRCSAKCDPQSSLYLHESLSPCIRGMVHSPLHTAPLWRWRQSPRQTSHASSSTRHNYGFWDSIIGTWDILTYLGSLPHPLGSQTARRPLALPRLRGEHIQWQLQCPAEKIFRLILIRVLLTGNFHFQPIL